LCVTISEDEQAEALFIGTKLYPLLTTPAQIKRTFRLLQLICNNCAHSRIRCCQVKKCYRSKH